MPLGQNQWALDASLKHFRLYLLIIVEIRTNFLYVLILLFLSIFEQKLFLYFILGYMPIDR